MAALVYQRHKHDINVFVWPMMGSAGPERPITRQGYHMVRWERGGMIWWAVSDLNEHELQDFADLMATP